MSPAREPDAGGPPVSGSLVVFVHRGTWADRYQAVTLAVTAAALGERVTVALFFEPLRLWAEARFDEGTPAEAGPARVVSLRDTLEEARRELGLEVVACDTATRLAGPDPDAIRATVDRVVTLPQLWKAAREGTYLVI
jgi:peroxiredoxin family protein